MKKKYKIVIGILVVLIIVIIVGLSFINNYRRGGGVDMELKCINYYGECTCIGLLRVMESYPAQHKCIGFESCKDINITECR